MIKNQARYGETSTNDDHLHFIEGRHAYQLFYALDSSMHVEELELSETYWLNMMLISSDY